MAKTIKFNLVCDGKPIRTIEDLQNNFSIEDVLAYYNNQLLHRWLTVRGYDKELEDVSAITCTKALDVIKELIRIFEVDTDEVKVEECVYMLQYQEERKELCSIYAQQNSHTKQIIDDYHEGYNQLVCDILLNPFDIALIKANIAEIVATYENLLSIDYRRLFLKFKDQSLPALMCLLMNEKSRKYYVPIEIPNADGTVTIDTDFVFDKKNLYDQICLLITRTDFERKLGGHLKTFSGVTDGYWKDLAPRGKKYMIVSIGDGDYVRSAGLTGGDLSHKDIKNKFVIVDGIDYKSNSSDRKLRYMEV